jgi:hypothetical protein
MVWDKPPQKFSAKNTTCVVPDNHTFSFTKARFTMLHLTARNDSTTTVTANILGVMDQPIAGSQVLTVCPLSD